MKNENPKRLNFDVPRHLIAQVRQLADMEGMTVNLWLRKALEKAVTDNASTSLH